MTLRKYAYIIYLHKLGRKYIRTLVTTLHHSHMTPPLAPGNYFNQYIHSVNTSWVSTMYESLGLIFDGPRQTYSELTSCPAAIAREEICYQMLRNHGFMWNCIPVAGTVCTWHFPNDAWKWQVFTERDSSRFIWGVADCCILGVQKSNLLMKTSGPLCLTWKTQEPRRGAGFLVCSWERLRSLRG